MFKISFRKRTSGVDDASQAKETGHSYERKRLLKKKEETADVKRDSGSRSEAPASRVSRTRVFFGGDPVRRGSRAEAEAGARSGEQRAGTVRARRLRESLLLPRGISARIAVVAAGIARGARAAV
ncbi:hypothetical protein NDU88_005356 [Pleurodeles waltl]|uniref:Uncharacterized protein n=1 Tax=Pleurodeles waltl TaxID=8319 RepID=A0AAV7V5N3_PLEWA|nr:hypothetical protein NDU88_005356 [Pleurodeles waltl]